MEQVEYLYRDPTIDIKAMKAENQCLNCRKELGINGEAKGTGVRTASGVTRILVEEGHGHGFCGAAQRFGG